MKITTKETKDFILFLDELRASGSTNMFGAGPFLREQFDLDKSASHKILCAWMRIDLTHPISERVKTLLYEVER